MQVLLAAGIICERFTGREQRWQEKVNGRSETNSNCVIEVIKEKGGSEEEINRRKKSEG